MSSSSSSDLKPPNALAVGKHPARLCDRQLQAAQLVVGGLVEVELAFRRAPRMGRGKAGSRSAERGRRRLGRRRGRRVARGSAGGSAGGRLAGRPARRRVGLLRLGRRGGIVGLDRLRRRGLRRRRGSLWRGRRRWGGGGAGWDSGLGGGGSGAGGLGAGGGGSSAGLGVSGLRALLGDPVDRLARALLSLRGTLLGLSNPIQHLLQAPLALYLLGLQLRELLGLHRPGLGLAGARLDLLESLCGALERVGRTMLLVRESRLGLLQLAGQLLLLGWGPASWSSAPRGSAKSASRQPRSAPWRQLAPRPPRGASRPRRPCGCARRLPPPPSRYVPPPPAAFPRPHGSAAPPQPGFAPPRPPPHSRRARARPPPDEPRRAFGRIADRALVVVSLGARPPAPAPAPVARRGRPPAASARWPGGSTAGGSAGGSAADGSAGVGPRPGSQPGLARRPLARPAVLGPPAARLPAPGRPPCEPPASRGAPPVGCAAAPRAPCAAPRAPSRAPALRARAPGPGRHAAPGVGAGGGRSAAPSRVGVSTGWGAGVAAVRLRGGAWRLGGAVGLLLRPTLGLLGLALLLLQVLASCSSPARAQRACGASPPRRGAGALRARACGARAESRAWRAQVAQGADGGRLGRGRRLTRGRRGRGPGRALRRRLLRLRTLLLRVVAFLRRLSLNERIALILACERPACGSHAEALHGRSRPQDPSTKPPAVLALDLALEVAVADLAAPVGCCLPRARASSTFARGPLK